MKFYYNNELMRTSKTRHYKYAVIFENGEKIKCLACSETKINAEKSLQTHKNTYIRAAESNLEFSKKPEKLEWLKERYGANYDPQKRYEREIENANYLKIVELEER